MVTKYYILYVNLLVIYFFFLSFFHLTIPLMDVNIEHLSSLIKHNYVQNWDSLISEDLQSIEFHMRTEPLNIPERIESILLSLFSANDGKTNPNVSYLIGVCLSHYYNVHNNSFWQFSSTILKEIKNSYCLPAIIALGVVTSKINDVGYKSQLPFLIQILLKCNQKEKLPYICQCFRRVFKRVGEYLSNLIVDVYPFLLRGISSTSPKLQKQSIIFLPLLLQFNDFNANDIILKLLAPNLGNPALRYEVAKTLGKLLFYGFNENTFFNGLNIYLKLLQKEENIKTVVSSFMIFLRFYPSSKIFQKIKLFVKFMFSATELEISLSQLSIIAKSLIKAIIGCVGETFSESICHEVIHHIKDQLTPGYAVILLITFIHCKPSSDDLLACGRMILPILTTIHNDLRKLSSYFYGTLAKYSHKTGGVFFLSFIDLLSDKNLIKNNEIDGFARAISSIILSFNIPYEKAFNLAIEFLKTENISSPKVFAAFMILSAIYYRKPFVNEHVINFLRKFFAAPISQNENKQLVFISLYLLQVIKNKPSNFSDYENIFKLYIPCFLQLSDHLTTNSMICFFRIAKECNFIWEKNLKISSAISLKSVQIIFKHYNEKNIEHVLKIPYHADPLLLLYGININEPNTQYIDSGVKTIYHYLIENINIPFEALLFKEIFINFSVWTSISENSTKVKIINKLFSKDAGFLHLSLINSLLTNSKIVPFLPKTGLPFFLNFENRYDLNIYRYAAACIAKWLKLFPELTNGCLDYIEKSNRSQVFVSYIIYECSKVIPDINRLVLCLHRIILTNSTILPLGILFKLIKSNKICKEFKPVIFSLLENNLIKGKYCDSKSLIICMKCFLCLKKVNMSIINCFLSFSCCYKNCSLFCGFELFRVFNSQLEDSNKISIIELTNSKPPYLLINKFKVSCSISDFETLINLLQQTNHVEIINLILSLVDKSDLIGFWTDICKSIVIGKSISLDDNQLNIRVIPTNSVIICSFQILIHIIPKIKAARPIAQNSIDDIVSIAFNSLEDSTGLIDYYCFSILSSILSSFANVSNNDGPLLNFYIAQLHPVLIHAFDEKRNIKSVAQFCIEYTNFLYITQNPLMNETISIITKGISKYKVTNDNLLVICKIVSKLISIVGSIKDYQLYSKYFYILFEKICKQEISIKAINNQLPDVTLSLIEFSNVEKKINKSIIPILILQELKSSCSLISLKTFIKLCNKIDINKSLAEYALQIFANNFKYETKSNDIDFNEFIGINEYVEIRKDDKYYFEFLTEISSIIRKDKWENIWEEVLSLSTKEKICYTSLFYLLKNSTNSNYDVLIKKIFIDLPNNSSQYLSLIYSIMPMIRCEYADFIINSIIQSNKLEDKAKLRIIRIILQYFGEYNLSTIPNLSHFLSINLIPNGINFIGSLLLDKRTIISGINLIYNGIMENTVRSIPSNLQSLPRIILFFDICFDAVKSIFKEEDFYNFEKNLISILFMCILLTSNQKDKTPVLSPALFLLKKIDKNIFMAKWEIEKRKKEIIKVISSSKNNEISLKTFANVIQRKSNSSWKTLSISDDTDEF